MASKNNGLEDKFLKQTSVADSRREPERNWQTMMKKISRDFRNRIKFTIEKKKFSAFVRKALDARSTREFSKTPHKASLDEKSLDTFEIVNYSLQLLEMNGAECRGLRCHDKVDKPHGFIWVQRVVDQIC